MKLLTHTSDSQRPRRKLMIRRDTLVELVPSHGAHTLAPCPEQPGSRECTYQSGNQFCCPTSTTTKTPTPSQDCKPPK